MHIFIVFALFPLFVVGDHCGGSLVCPAIAANVEAILDARKMLGCCSHDACMPLPGGSAQCSQKLASSLHPCMQKDYGGNRAVCVGEVVVTSAPAVCEHLWESCEGLRALTKYLQLAQAVSGCPMREGMGIGAFIATIFAAPLALATIALAPLAVAATAAVAVAKPIMSAAAFPPLIPSFISAEASTEFQLAASPTRVTGIVLVGGSNPWQGNVYAEDPKGRWGAVCGNFWTIKNAHVVCRQLGQMQAIKFYGVTPLHITPQVDGPGSRYGDLPFGFTYVLERVACVGTESRLIDCPIVPHGVVLPTCDATTVAGLQCV